MASQGRQFQLSASQSLIWTGQLLQPNEPLYNMALAFEIHGSIDTDWFQQAFQKLLEHAEIMRTVMIDTDHGPKQLILDQVDFIIEVIDYSDQLNPRDAARKFLDQRVKQKFGYEELLFDTLLCKLTDDHYLWYFNQHHVTTDAWSTSILYTTQQHYYGLACRGKLEDAEALPPYSAYLDEELSVKSTRQWLRAQAYWTEKLSRGFVPSTFYQPTPEQHGTRTERMHFRLGTQRSNRLKKLCQQAEFVAFSEELGLFQLFLTTLFAYLYRISGNQSLAIGTPSHNRANTELKQTAGLFIEIFPVLVDIKETDTFSSLHARVSREVQQLLINTAPGVSGVSQNRCFDVVLNYITASFGAFDGFPKTSEWIHSGYGDHNHLFRLQIHNFDRGDEFVLHFDLNEDCFVGDQRNWVIQHFLRLMDAFLDDPNTLVDAIPLLDAESLPSLPSVANSEHGFVSILDCFYQSVAKTGSAVALQCQQLSLSYDDLNTRSNRLAHYLVERGITSGTVVAICLPRSVEMIISLLAILKSGAAYVPIDPDYPAERIKFILDDSGSTAVILDTDQKAIESLSEVLRIKVSDADKLAAVQDPPIVKIEADCLAYIIYTSGSTGKPKGVAVHHAGLANYISWARDFYVCGEQLDFPLFTTLSFDLTVTSIYTPLTSGARLVIYPQSDSKINPIQSVIEDNAVDIIKLTPSHLLLIQSMNLSASRVKKLIVGGEDFKTQLARIIDRRFSGNIQIYNEYGPTEGTVACMIHRFDPNIDQDSSVPIGKSIDNVEVYLLDRHLNPVPQGVIGEIYIAGICVAKGYLNKPELSSERFVNNPFEAGQKMYASGDLGRWASEGQMVYLGRSDNQVKVHGVRIELGEIEAAISNYANIETAVVTPWKSQQSCQQDHSYCLLCGLDGNHPDAHLDEKQICQICRSCETQADKARGYFSNLQVLEEILARARAAKTGKYDCMMLLSGGKDSSYVLCKLVDMGMTPLVFTLDNGYISEGAKTNMRRLVDQLGVDLHVGQTAAMNSIFVESLKLHSNVCNGCFKTIYTLSIKLAHELGIGIIVTGLSRGQIFETRLVDLFRHDILDAKKIDQTIIEARKAYHRTDDVISSQMDVSLFQQDKIFESVQIVDFYRYCDVTLEEVLIYLTDKIGWVRPADTGRSTNCLINEAGIFIHKKQRGFHNYALPYSWDVRLGHKQMHAAREELDDQIDVDRVHELLTEIGYQDDADQLLTTQEDRLLGFYVAPIEYSEDEIQGFLQSQLPKEFIPAHLIQLESLPLTKNAKIDRDALPVPDRVNRRENTDFEVPETSLEKQLANIWASVLRVDRVGRNENFFDLGGDSILNIQIVGLAQKNGLALNPQMIFEYPSVAELAKVAGTIENAQIDQGPVSGDVALTPIQHRYFEANPEQFSDYQQVVLLECIRPLDPQVLQQALDSLILHHDMLRGSFHRQANQWRQTIKVDNTIKCNLRRIKLAEDINLEIDSVLDKFNNPSKPLFSAVLIENRNGPDFLLLAAHHLIVDGVSWWILLDDLQSVIDQISGNQPVELPKKTSSFQTWSAALIDYANSNSVKNELEYWLQMGGKQNLPSDFGVETETTGFTETITVSLNSDETLQLLQQVAAKFHCQIPELLITALMQALHNWTGSNHFCLDMEGHGREPIFKQIDLLRTLGWFTSVFPIRLQYAPSQRSVERLRSVKEQMRAIPNRGIGFSILRYLSEDSIVRDRLACLADRQILFNYLGHWDQALAHSAQFCFAQPIMIKRSPSVRPVYPLEVDAMIYRGCLQVNWVYDATQFCTATINETADHFVESLRSLINDASSSGETGLSPTDFPEADLDQASLDSLLSDFGDLE